MITWKDLVQDYLVPAMRRESLKIVGVWLTKSSSVESIFRELPQSNVEELAIRTDKDYRYTVEVSPLCVYMCMCVCVCVCVRCVCVCVCVCACVHAQLPISNKHCSTNHVISVLSPTAVW